MPTLQIQLRISWWTKNGMDISHATLDASSSCFNIYLPSFYLLRGSPQAGLDSFGAVKKLRSRTTSTIERTRKTLNKEKKIHDDSCSKRNFALGLLVLL
jgi:hypothetical protein